METPRRRLFPLINPDDPRDGPRIEKVDSQVLDARTADRAVLTLVRSLRKKHARGGIGQDRGHPRRRAPFGMSYRHPVLIPPLKL